MHRNLTGLLKLAQYFPTVGDVMNRVNADMTVSNTDKHDFISAINNAGLTVNQPGFIIPGYFPGISVNKYLAPTPFWAGHNLPAKLHNKTSQIPPLWTRFA